MSCHAHWKVTGCVGIPVTAIKKVEHTMQTNQIEQQSVAAATPASAKRGIRVTVENLFKSYSGREVLKSIELVLEPGEFVAVVGRSNRTCGV